MDRYFVPTFEDVDLLPINKHLPSDLVKRLENIAHIVEQIVEERREVALAALSEADTLNLLLKTSSNLENIFRSSEGESIPVNVGYGIYPVFSYIERHPTEFNCDYYFDVNANLVLRAAQALDGDAVLIAPKVPLDLSIGDPVSFRQLMDRIQGFNLPVAPPLPTDKIPQILANVNIGNTK